MKKYILVLIALGMSVYPAMSQVKFGIEAGMTASHVATGKGATESISSSAGLQVGLTMDYSFSRKWVLMSGLSFLQKGGEIGRELTSNAGNVNLFHSGPAVNHVSFKMNYLELPVKIGYSFSAGHHVKLIPSVGVYAAYGFNAGECPLDVYHTYENYGAYMPDNWKPFSGYNGMKQNEALTTPLDKLNHWDFGGIVGLKAVISDHYTASFNYSHSIKSIQKQMDLRNSTFQLSVGYRF